MKTKKIMVGIRIQPNTLEKIDGYAGRLNLSRNQLIINLIDGGLEDLLLLDRSGMLGMGIGFRKLVEQLRRSDDGQQTLID